ncbi:hypothetical protein OAN59_08330 [Alphaproteobacteria bacterium]|nr:hypothetical protein [Alphaproteobacteria bacterium]
MTEFISTARFLDKEGSVDEFANRQNEYNFNGMADQVTPVRSGGKTFCWIDVFRSETALASCRPKMIQ